MDDQFYDSVTSHDERYEDGLRKRRSQTMKRSISDTEFICSCCFELMLQPTSLPCGHSFCRHCIAIWFLTSNRHECPSCRQHWQGKPQVNISLRNLIEKCFEEELRIREEVFKDPEIRNKVALFERKLNSAAPDQPKKSKKDFLTGVFLSLAVVLAIYLAWLWRHSDSDLLIHKPVSKWTQADVSEWMRDLGGWTAEFINTTEEIPIDGRILLALDEENIDSLFNSTQSVYLSALTGAITHLKANGVKFPTNLWEFKLLYPGSSLFLLYGLKDFPRTTFIHMYLFQYQDQFLPFIHQTCPADSFGHLSFSVPDLPSPTIYQWIEFLSKCFVLPYWLIAQFVLEFMTIHYWTSRLCLLDCLLLTVLEAATFLWVCKCGLKSIILIVKNYCKAFLTCCVIAVIWPIMPSFICDIYFYHALYFQPWMHVEKGVKALRGNLY